MLGEMIRYLIELRVVRRMLIEYSELRVVRSLLEGFRGIQLS